MMARSSRFLFPESDISCSAVDGSALPAGDGG